MTRSELAVLSQAHAVALTAIAVHELRQVPFSAAFALRELAAEDMPSFLRPCHKFREALRESHGRFDPVVAAGRELRDAVARAMAFVPHDINRVDIHG